MPGGLRPLRGLVASLPGGTQFGTGAVGPGPGTESFEGIGCEPQVVPRLGAAAVPTQPLTEQQASAGALERRSTLGMECQGFLVEWPGVLL
jgi:hypothetical protein